MSENKSCRKLKSLFFTALSFLFILVVCVAWFLKPIFFPEKVTLPSIEKITKVEIQTDYTDPVIISEPEDLRLIEDFINQYPDEWYIPPLVPGVAAKLEFKLYNEDKVIEIYGVSKDFATRNYGRLIQDIPEEEIKSFVTTLSPILEESLYPVIPISPTELESLSYWEDKLLELKDGTSRTKINQFLIDNNVATTYVSPERFINVNLFVVNEGRYVDTVIAAQLVLYEDNSLSRTRFFGYRLSEKAELKKLAYWESKLSDLPQGAPFEEIEKFVRENDIVIRACSDRAIQLNLYTVNDTWIWIDESNGKLVDVVGAAQLVLDENKGLNRVDILGHQQSDKIDIQTNQISSTCQSLRGN